jgi:uncharacterized protein involved in exopolysaccharide biosynthesis
MHPTSFDDFDSPQLFDVRAAVRKLWTRRLLIVAVTLTVLFAAALYTVTTKPSYTATAAILVDPRDVKTTNIDSVLPGIGADSAAIASQVSVIQSRDFLGEVFAALQLQTDPEYAGGGFASQLIGAIKSSAPPTSEAILQRFLGTVSVEREGLTYVIDIGVKSSDPVKAARIANAIVEHYQASSSAQQSTATTDVTAALNSRIANLQSDVAGAERAVADFRQQHGILDDTTGGTLQSQIDQLTTQILAAKDALNQAQTKYDQAAAAGTSAAALAQLSAVSSSATLDKLRDDYNQRAATLASAEATLGPKHPTIITAKAELARVSALLGQEGARLAKQLKADRNAAQANLDKLQANLATLRQQSGDSDIAQVELRQLQRQADAARAVLNDFMQRSTETTQIQGLQASQVHVIAQAAPPPDPTWPKPMLLLPVSAVLGFMLGSGIALFLGDRAPLPAPEPVSTGPNRPRRATPRLEPVRSMSAARRLAGLDRARSDLVTGRRTPTAIAVQGLLRQVIEALPRQRGPYILAVSAADAELADAGADLIAGGLGLIGGHAVRLAGADVPERVDDDDFVLLGPDHPLATHADLRIVVTTTTMRVPAGSDLVLCLDLEDATDPAPAFLRPAALVDTLAARAAS